MRRTLPQPLCSAVRRRCLAEIRHPSASTRDCLASHLLLYEGDYEISHRDNPYSIATGNDQEVPEAAFYHLLCGLLKRCVGRHGNYVRCCAVDYAPGIRVVARCDGVEQVALGDDS